MAIRDDDFANYTFDPVYHHLLRAKEVSQRSDVPEELKDQIRRAIELCQQRCRYCEDHTSGPSAALASLIQETRSYPWEDARAGGRVSYDADPRMLTGNEEAQLIKCLTSACKAQSALEIGLFTGCVSLAMAEVLPADGKVVSLEIDAGIADVARSFLEKSPVGNKIQIITGPATESLKMLAEKQMKFNVIFIDADKKGYTSYYKMIFELELLAPNGTIIVDNVLKNGYPYSGEKGDSDSAAIVEFNKVVLADEKVHKVMIPMRDGIYLIRRMTKMGD